MHSHITDLGHDCGTWLPGGRILRPIFSGDIAQEFVERGRKRFGMFLTTVQQVALLSNRYKRLEMAAIAAARSVNGELIYIPRSLQGVYTDSAGTTKVTAVGDVIGGIADKQYGLSNTLAGPGYHATQATTAAKPTLVRLANGNYAMSFNGTSNYIDHTYRDYYNLGSCTFISSQQLILTGQTEGLFSLGNSGTNIPLYTLELLSTASSLPAGLWSLIRSDSNTNIKPNTSSSAPVFMPAPSTLEFVDTGSVIKINRDGIYNSTDQSYTRSGTVTTNMCRTGALARATPQNYSLGTISLQFIAPTVASPASIKSIARFAAFLSGAPYA